VCASEKTAWAAAELLGAGRGVCRATYIARPHAPDLTSVLFEAASFEWEGNCGLCADAGGDGGGGANFRVAAAPLTDLHSFPKQIPQAKRRRQFENSQDKAKRKLKEVRMRRSKCVGLLFGWWTGERDI